MEKQPHREKFEELLSKHKEGKDALIGEAHDEALDIKKKVDTHQKEIDELTGQKEIIEHVIDCDAPPFVPDGCEVEVHNKGGQLKFDASQVELYLSAAQKNGIEGNKLHEKLAGGLVLNANVLDYLLANPHLIPEEWKVKEIFFWGTVYRTPRVRDSYGKSVSDGNEGVRCLYESGDRWGWKWGYPWLGIWNDSRPAATLRVRAS